jgi:hypothetical protein
VPFILLATANSAGYRYGASDQAFYLPAILDRLEPSLFPRDSALINSQARLTAVDETVAPLARVLPLGLPVLMAALYAGTLALLAWAALSIADSLYRTGWAAVGLLSALTLRHAITRTGTNTLEGYFHPRQLAFALGLAAIACWLRPRSSPDASSTRSIGRAFAPVLLLVGAGLVHPTTALWFTVWLGVALLLAEPGLRAALALIIATGILAGVWALTLGPLQGRLTPMDEAWLQTLATKDYLFPLEWPAYVWLINLGYVPVILWAYRRRRAAGVLRAREPAFVAGCLALVGVFAIAVLLHGWKLALAVQLQPARVFWMLDFVAVAYVVWLLAEGSATGTRRAAATALVLILITTTRSAYVLLVRFPERPIAGIILPDNDWNRVMTWARTSTDVSSHWLADPIHAARYGVSVRVAGQRDVFVEAIKDSAIGMYSRPVAMRTQERLEALGDFGGLTADSARALASRYELDYLVTETSLDLPLAWRSGPINVYRLRSP